MVERNEHSDFHMVLVSVVLLFEKELQIAVFRTGNEFLSRNHGDYVTRELKPTSNLLMNLMDCSAGLLCDRKRESSPPPQLSL